MITPPVPVGFSFPVDPKYIAKPCHNLGGYTIVEDLTEGLIICGFNEVRLFELPITNAVLTVMDTNTMLPSFKSGVAEKDRETSIFYTMEYEPNSIVYITSYANYAWAFTDLKDAMSLLHLIVDIKRSAIQNALDKGEALIETPNIPQGDPDGNEDSN